MKPEEAIEQIKKHKLCDSTGFHDEMDAEAEELAIEALEKMIPMKKGTTVGISGWPTKACGNCGSDIEEAFYDYCPYCGQRQED